MSNQCTAHISCPDCNQSKPRSDYYTDQDSPYGVSWYCKICKRARTNAYRAKDREHYNAINRRNYHLRKRMKQ